MSRLLAKIMKSKMYLEIQSSKITVGDRKTSECFLFSECPLLQTNITDRPDDTHLPEKENKKQKPVRVFTRRLLQQYLI